MRFVILHKAGLQGEPALLPPVPNGPRITLQESAALERGAAGACMRFSNRVPQRSECRFVNGTAGLAGLSIVEAESRQAVTDWLEASPPRDGDAEFEIRETGCAGGLPGVDASSAAALSLPRFLILLKADADTEAEAPSDALRLDAMARRNDEGVKSGLLLAADGLKSSARGARVRFAGGKTSVLDGPFAETKELVAGFWLIQAASLDQAVAWVQRYPYAQDNPEVEIRPVAAAA
ncbi:MAG: YciI family protein [Variovorax sp.]